jgi:hypothetical protein
VNKTQTLDKKIVEINSDVLYCGDCGLLYKFLERYHDTMHKIKNADEIRIEWKPADKEILSYFGMAFMANKRILLTNREKAQPTPIKSYTNVILSIDEICRKGESLPAVDWQGKGEENTIYVICPVRKLRELHPEEEQKIRRYVAEKMAAGNKVNFPDPDAEYQKDPNGLNICLRHRGEVAEASEAHCHWYPGSEGSVFDLATALMAGRPIKLINRNDVARMPRENFTELLVLNDAKYSIDSAEDILN